MSDHPSRIDRYEVQEILGRGAMGIVYRALDPVIGRVVALKTISLNDALNGPLREDCLVRFAREARAAGLLSHPNIVTIYDVGETPQESVEGIASYIAMEFVEGRTLRQMVPHGQQLSQDQVLDMAMQVARGLDYAHRRGIVHRDVKPANILVREDGLVKLADFGVARIESSELTRTGQSVGSPSYIAPEMLLEQPVDGRSDLFSLGVILYELLTGEKPFKGETIAALYHQVLSVTPVPPSQRNPEVAVEWDAIILKLLEKAPEQRYASAGHLIEDLRSLELGRPLHQAEKLEVRSSRELSLDETLPVSALIPEEVLERVIEQDAHDTSASVMPAPYSPQLKALLALLTVAGFALMVIIAAAMLRPSTGRAAGAAAESSAPQTMVGLNVRLAHNLRDGRMEVSMDGKTLLTETFRGERARLRMQGSLSRRVSIPAGRHTFKVSVEDDGGRSWSTTSLRDVREGADATLLVEVKGIVKKTLDLTWN